MNAQPAADVRSDVETKEGKMKKAILATKVGMTQIFQEDGTLIPVTVLQAGPCVVTQIKTEIGRASCRERV